RDEDGGGPLEAVAQLGGPAAGGVVRVDADVAGLPRAQVEARDVAAVLARVDDVRVGPVGGGEAGLAAADRVPVARPDARGRQAVAGSGRGAPAVVGPRDVIGRARIDVDVVELADGQQRRQPRLAAVGGDVDAAVVAVDHAPGVLRVDPQVVMIDVV